MVWRPNLDEEAVMRVSLVEVMRASELLFKLKIKQTLAGLVIKKLNSAGQNVNVLVGLAGGALSFS